MMPLHVRLLGEGLPASTKRVLDTLPLVSPHSASNEETSVSCTAEGPSSPSAHADETRDHSASSTSSSRKWTSAVDALITQSFQRTDDAFYILDLATVARKAVQWRNTFPSIAPFYAVKCNPNPAILALLASLGCGFDCASETELRSVLDLEGMSPDRIVFANPCKARHELQFARDRGVSLMTFDNRLELFKIQTLYPNARLLLRIKTHDPHNSAKIPLSTKYGASLSSCNDLITLSKRLNLNVVGVSFHVGSGVTDPDIYKSALRDSRTVFDMALEAGYTTEDLCVLDIGGGYPGGDPVPDTAKQSTDASPLAAGIALGDVAAVVTPLIEELFPSTVKVIAEPGRFFVEASCTLAVRVIAKKSPFKITTTNLSVTPAVPSSRNMTLYNDRDDGDTAQADCRQQEDASASSSSLHTIAPSAPLNSPSAPLVVWPPPSRPRVYYFVNEGAYGSFKDSILLQENFAPRVLLHVCDSRMSSKRIASTIFGPTDNPDDLVHESVLLPPLGVGSWLAFRSAGAYTLSLASCQNGNQVPDIFLTWIGDHLLRITFPPPPRIPEVKAEPSKSSEDTDTCGDCDTPRDPPSRPPPMTTLVDERHFSLSSRLCDVSEHFSGLFISFFGALRGSES